MTVAIVNALVWSILTPAFEIPDEPVQVGYVQYLAETGKLPRPITPYFYGSAEENAAMAGVPFNSVGLPSWSRSRAQALKAELAQKGLSRVDERAAGYIGSAPPLYFALATIPYKLASSGNFFDRLFAMRLLSVLLAGATVGFVFLFMRELFPRTRWAWTVGALAVAFQPVFGFMAGGVHYDNLLWTASAALFFALAYGFRRGLTWKVGVGIGSAALVGVLSKGTMYGVLPGAALAVAVMAWRTAPPARRRALIGVLAAAATFAIPFALWLVASNAIWHRGVNASATAGFTSVHAGLGGQIDYIWEFYLPQLPFMQHNWFSSYPTYPLWQSYIQGFVGRFGWFQYGFPMWANWLGLAVYLGLIGLAAAAVSRARSVFRRRWMELAAYAVMAIGVLLLVNVAGFRYFVQSHQAFEQTRYIFPLLPLYAALVALAARGGGRRWAPALGGVLIVAAVAQDLFAQLITIGRFYA